MSSDGGLRALFRAHLPGAGHWVSIETGATEGGVPDLNVCAPGGLETWIECKWTTGWVCSLRPGQVGWILARVRRGGRVLVATRRQCAGGPRSEAADELWVHAGCYARELKQGGLRAVPPILRSGGGPARWDWAAVHHLLR
jgi:hypothetical protein